jgi:predicted outer membrane repeat protein
VFVANTAREGGAVSLGYNSSLYDCIDCFFENNQAFERGGAISVKIESLISNTSRSIFKNNS